MKYRIEKIVKNIDIAIGNFRDMQHELNNVLQVIILQEEKAKKKKE